MIAIVRAVRALAAVVRCEGKGNRWFKRFAVVPVATMLVVGACSSSGGQLPAASGTPQTTAARSGVLKVYLVNAMTGQSASFGSRAVHGSQQVVKSVNDSGGFADTCGNRYTIEDTVWDMAADREQAVAGLRRAADDPTVLAVIGSTPSTGFLAMVPVAGQIKIPLLSPGSAGLVKEWNAYAFRVSVGEAIGNPAMMRLLKAKFPLEKVGVIYDITADAERFGAETVRDSAGTIGYDVVAFESVKAGDTDFRPQLTRMKGIGVKWLGIYAPPPELTKIVRQMSEMGMLPGTQVFSHGGAVIDPNNWDLTNGLVKDSMTWTEGANLASNDPEIKAFVDSYKKQFPGDEPSQYSLHGVQAMGAVIDAVKRSCTVTDREKFRDALAKTNITTIGRRVQFDNPRDKPNGENFGSAASVTVVKVTGRGTAEDVK